MHKGTLNQWRSCSFASLCLRLVNGGTPETDIPAYWHGETPWVTGADFTTKGIGEIRRHVSAAGIRSSATSVVKAGNLLAVTRTGVGKLAIAPCDIAISQDITGIYVDEQQAHTGFVFYLLARELEELKKLNQGTSINGIIRSDLERHEVRIPVAMSVQTKITSVLRCIDTAIEKTEALIEKYQQIKAGLMHDLFTRGVLPNGQLRPTTESRKTKFGWMPREWRVGSLLEATDSSRQPILTGPFGADLGNDDFISEGVPVLRIGNVQQGRLDLENLLFVSERKARALFRYRIRTGDLLFARQGATTGRNALADELANGYLINYHIIRVALDHERCAPTFIEAAFSSEIVKRQIERDKGRGTREGINTAQLTSLEFPLAMIDEQRRIAGILAEHTQATKSAQAELNKLCCQKLGLMQDLLTGKVEVNVEQESAEPVNA